MKNLFKSIYTLVAAVAIPAVFAATALGEGSSREFNAKITNGSLSITNDASDSYCVEAIAIKYASQCTNTLTVTRIRPINVSSNVTVVSTNVPFTSGSARLIGNVTTNTYAIKSVEFSTNTMFTASATNVDEVVYGVDRMNEGWHVAPGDIIKYSLSYTSISAYITIDAE